MTLHLTDHEMARNRAALDKGRAAQMQKRADRIEDYLFLASVWGGTAPPPEACKSGTTHALSAVRFAERLGVSPRTIIRYRKALREAS